MKKGVLVLMFTFCLISFSQEASNESLPYYQVPEYSDKFTAGTMAARMVDALGFRFYWASIDLSESDLDYKLNGKGRSTKETISHIYDLSKIIVNSTLKKPNAQGDEEDMTYIEKREAVLKNLKIAAEILRKSEDISQFKIIFGQQKIPFWNQVNGPIADAIWHCGQIAVYRRASGNPINSKVNHFTGRVNN